MFGRAGGQAHVVKHLVALTALALVAQGANVNGGHDNLITWAWVCLADDASIEIDDHAAPRPGKGRVMA
jgi:hypothetical protein